VKTRNSRRDAEALSLQLKIGMGVNAVSRVFGSCPICEMISLRLCVPLKGVLKRIFAAN